MKLIKPNFFKFSAPAPFTNLIRVKKVFPMQPAWESGQFQEGDILIGAGGQALSGLTLRQVNIFQK